MTEQEFLNNLTIIIDSREQNPYSFGDRKIEIAALPVGDYYRRQKNRDMDCEKSEKSEISNS